MSYLQGDLKRTHGSWKAMFMNCSLNVWFVLWYLYYSIVGYGSRAASLRRKLLSSYSRLTSPETQLPYIKVHLGVLQRKMLQRTNECYNEQFLSVKSGCNKEHRCYNERGGILLLKYIWVCYNERCYNERMLQRTVFINKIRMQQRT